MKTLILMFSFVALFVKLDVSSVRLEYKRASQSKEKTMALFSQLENISKNDEKVLVAYKGAVTTMKSRYLNGVKNKKQIFKEGISLIEFAIQNQPDNIEIRFVRMSVQQNVPKFLGYNNDLEEDKKFIFGEFDQIQSTELQNYIKEYILYSNHFTEEEKNVFSQP